MTPQLALVLSRVFCLILASSAQEVCQLDASMTMLNDNKKRHFLFRGSKIYEVEADTDGTLRKGPVHNITAFWKNWSGEKVTRTMFLYEEDNSAAIIGDNLNTHLVRFNENFDVKADSYEYWWSDSFYYFRDKEIRVSQGVLISNYSPGRVCVYFDTLKQTRCRYMVIDLKRRYFEKSIVVNFNNKNPDLVEWSKNFQKGQMKMIGILKTHREKHWVFEAYWELFIAFIERDNQIWQCAGTFYWIHYNSDYKENCTNISQYKPTSKLIFGCDEKDVLQFTTSRTTTSTVETSKLTATAETTTGFDDKQDKIDWILKALIGALIIVILGISCYGISVKKKNDSHEYELLKDKKRKKFKPRRAKDLKLFGSSSSESEKSVSVPKI